ncbi:thioesterase family protein [Natronobeatus ordinarius]|uniref:thioesterase family protein n=1 Tax=Natronobeatus ordinarius TaxID=2963433 RepID=UPI0020CE2366|nr:acyl-[acyl-carrier-protein] thioesterase [Natronobeatus ordinarius]
MRTIDARPVRFGELAGPLAHSSTIFDWQIRALEYVVATFGYGFPDLIAEGKIPHAPVAVDTTVHRYPALEDVVTVEVDPVAVGESSLELCYEMRDGTGEPLWAARITHVTVDENGAAVALPERVRRNVADVLVDRAPAVGPAKLPDDDADDASDVLATISSTVPIRSPHTEGVSWAYFEEYPRFATIALEEFLEERGSSLAATSGEKQPFRMGDWHWEFRSPVPLGSTLAVEGDVLAVDEETVRVGHTFTCDGRLAIEGVTEYGCFDRAGEPIAFDGAHLEPFDA